MDTGEFLSRQRLHLLARRESKTNLLESDGEQALSHSYKDITRIDFALKRIDEGQYGLCCNCGCHIDDRRLLLIPETPFCAECATHIEAH
jgi:RNA polymerase-binding transcription factor DksA